MSASRSPRDRRAELRCLRHDPVLTGRLELRTREVRPCPSSIGWNVAVANAVLRPVGHVDQSGLLVEDRDRQVLSAQDLADLVADGVDDRVVFELLRQCRAYLVDDRQLGVALLRLGEQPLRLVEQPRVLEGDAEVRGDRRQKSLVRLAERVLGQSLKGDQRRARDHRPVIGTPSHDSSTSPSDGDCPEGLRLLVGAQA